MAATIVYGVSFLIVFSAAIFISVSNERPYENMHFTFWQRARHYLTFGHLAFAVAIAAIPIINTFVAAVFTFVCLCALASATYQKLNKIKVFKVFPQDTINLKK